MTNPTTPTFETVSRQVDTLHRMKLRNCKPHPVHPEEIKDMIERVFRELELDFKKNPEFRKWYERIIRGFRLRSRTDRRKKKNLRTVRTAA